MSASTLASAPEVADMFGNVHMPEGAKLHTLRFRRRVGLSLNSSTPIHRAKSKAHRATLPPSWASDGADPMRWGEGADNVVKVAAGAHVDIVHVVARVVLGDLRSRMGLTVRALYEGEPPAKAAWAIAGSATLWPSEPVTVPLVRVAGHASALAFIPFAPSMGDLGDALIEVVVGAVIS